MPDVAFAVECLSDFVAHMVNFTRNDMCGCVFKS